jgi:hypothetical protein
MALRREDLLTAPDAVVVDFPVRIAAARRRRARRTYLVRRIVAASAVVVLLGGIVSLSASAQNGEVVSRAGAPDAVVVDPGETLWDLAVRYAPEGSDRTAYVDEIIALNGVSGVAPPGTSLDLP